MKANKQAVSETIARLEGEITKLKGERDRLTKAWIDESMKSGQMLPLTMDNAKLKKQLQIVEHIASGRSSEAIVALLDPIQMCINLDVRCDDKTGRMAKEETLKAVVASAVEHLGKLALKHDEQK